MLRIASVSDCHGMLEPRLGSRRLREKHLLLRSSAPIAPVELPPADVLIIAGDYCPNFGGGETADAKHQLHWLRSSFVPFLKTLPYRKIIVVSGNHDWVHFVSETSATARRLLEGEGISYLQDELMEFEGTKIYGSPWQPWFFDWAFNFPKRDLTTGLHEAKKTWAKIPDGADVVVTHGPALNILDLAPGDRHVGCPMLRDRLLAIKPKLHLCGHIHGAYGQTVVDGVKFGNVSLCDEEYVPVNAIQVFEVEAAARP